jgi:hypothetical protein
MFCGSKVFDFLTIDFNSRTMPSAKTYIRLKANGKTVIAPVIIDTISAEYHSSDYVCVAEVDGREYMRTPCNPTMTVNFIVAGDMIQIEGEGDTD